MTQPPQTVRNAWFVYVAAVVAAVILANSILGSASGIVVLFGRWDVLACSCMAAFPLALLSSNYLHEVPNIQRLVISSGYSAVAVVAIAFSRSFSVSGSGEFLLLALFRMMVATAIVSTAVIICSSFPSLVRSPLFLSKSWWTAGMLAAFAILVPAAYVDAVTDGIRIDLENSLAERRYALAEHQAQTMLELKPSVSVNGRQVTVLHSELRQTVRNLESELQKPIAARAPIGDVARRITLLMHLDRFEDALRLLGPLRRDARFVPTCLDYQGLCWQRLQQYPESLDAYENSVAYWSTQPDSDRKRVSLASAWKGIGFASRHLGQRTMEEQAYRTLVDLSPTAENHFLLAQCYSEHQKSVLAAEHSTIAMQLNPKLRVQSESMLTSMSRDHFGCLQIP